LGSSSTEVGFKPVGVLRDYERDTDGRGWHDGLLMERWPQRRVHPAAYGKPSG
jgi:hypothetical protein